MKFPFIALLLLVCLSAFSQPSAIYGSTNIGGANGGGMFFTQSNGQFEALSYSNNLAYPYCNIISYGDKIYGLALKGVNSSDVSQIFVANTPMGPISDINPQISLSARSNTYSLNYGGFAIKDNYIVAQKSFSEMMIINATTGKIQRIVPDKMGYFISPCVPAINNGKAYYTSDKFYNHTMNMNVSEIDLVTGESRTMASFTQRSGFHGPILAANGNVYFQMNDHGSRTLARVGGGSGGSFWWIGDMMISGPYTQIENKFYNVLESEGSNNSGIIFRLDPSTSKIDTIFYFPADHSTPTNGLVSIGNSLYGIAINKNGERRTCIYKFNLSSRTISYLKEYPVGDKYGITSLLAHNGKLYAYAPQTATKPYGEVSEVDTTGSIKSTASPYYPKKLWMGVGKPIKYKDKYYSIVDSSLMSYDINSKSITVEYEFKGSERLVGNQFGLTRVNSLLLGVAPVDYNKSMVFFFDLENKGCFKLMEIPVIAVYDEITFLNNHLYIPEDIDSFDLLDIDLSAQTYKYRLLSNDYNRRIIAKGAQIGTDLYYPMVSLINDTFKGRILKYSTIDGSVNTLEEFNGLIGKQTTQNLVSSEDTLYGTFKNENAGLLYSIDVKSKNRKIEYQSDSLYFVDNMRSVNRVIYGQVSSTSSRYLFTFHTQTKEFKLFPAPLIDDLAHPLISVEGDATNTVFELHGTSNGWTVYPNPASNYITIKNKEGKPAKSIAVYDLHGKMIWSASGSSDFKIDELQTWPSGLYNITILDEGGSHSSKLIVP